MNQLFLQYSYLQILDFLTTVAFLVHGIQEANPVVRFAMKLCPSVIAGLILIKTAALLLGVYCWRMRREKLLSRINILFALVVAWNLVAMIFSAVRA
ncbi:MAG: hypothetical protein JO022_04825 [Acidobacteriaceae bacterium]|nr:hypothetical protein [Acidobacteriaceae bacterium]